MTAPDSHNNLKFSESENERTKTLKAGQGVSQALLSHTTHSTGQRLFHLLVTLVYAQAPHWVCIHDTSFLTIKSHTEIQIHGDVLNGVSEI